MAHKCINIQDLIKSNEHWRIFQCVLSFENKKKILFKKQNREGGGGGGGGGGRGGGGGGHWVKHQ